MLAVEEQAAGSIAITVQVLEEQVAVQTAVQAQAATVLLRQLTPVVAAVAVVLMMIAQQARAAREVPAFASSATIDEQRRIRMGMGPRTFALIENGVVVNIISMYAKNLTDFPNAVLAADRPVMIGDRYEDGVFLRNGVAILTDEEIAMFTQPPDEILTE